jgi:PBP1b-binding outer membrane lipoprotein LpoB
MTTTTVGYGGNAEDKLAEAINAKKAYLEGKAAVPDATPDFTLSGKIIQTAKVQVGNQRQNSYIFQLSLTQVGSGLAVWEDEKTITKQYKKGGVSW